MVDGPGLFYLSEYTKPAVAFALAAVAGMLGFLTRVAEAKGPWKPVVGVVLRTLLAGFTSGFVGVLVGFMAAEFQWSNNITFALSGVFGWVGADASLRVVERTLYARLGLRKEEKADGME